MDTQALHNVLTRSMQPDDTVRAQAENELKQAANSPGFAVGLLSLVDQAKSPADQPVRLSASLAFKNFVKESWDEGELPSLTSSDRALIKTHLVDLMTSVPAQIQATLCEAINVIAKSDFPAQWDGLLPALVAKLQVQDWTVINGTLMTANVIFKRFRYVHRSDELYVVLKLCLDHFQQPLLHMYKMAAGVVEQGTASNQPTAALLPVMAALRTMSRIFFSLNFQDPPEFFEDHIQEWMHCFKFFLNYRNAALAAADASDDEPDPVTLLQAAILDNLSLYAEKYEEIFATHLQEVAQAVWQLMTSLTAQPKFDQLAVSGMKFLALLVTRSMYHIFQDPAAQQTIVEQIVLPNMVLPEALVEEFEDAPTNFIHADIEGSDQETRRRAACDLVRGLCKLYQESVTPVCTAILGQLLQRYAANPADNWRDKDTAVSLVLALSVRANSAQHGVSQMNELVDVSAFLDQHVMPELNADVNALPIVKANCLKMLSTFRNQFSSSQLLGLLPLLVNHMRSEHYVIRAYAAGCVERFLWVKDVDEATKRRVPRLSGDLIQPQLAALYDGLFAAVQDPEEANNEYVIKALMRVIDRAGGHNVPMVAAILAKLTEHLQRVAANAVAPTFNHYLFESVAALLRAVCTASPGAVGEFETLLFPPFQTILGMNVTEFHPYVFQILTQLLLLRADSALSNNYTQLFQPLLQATLWEERGNVAALSGLLQAYLRKGAEQLVTAGQIVPILGIFQKLIAARSSEMHAFALAAVVVECVPLQFLDEHLVGVFGLVLTRFQASRTAKFARLAIRFFCLIAAVHGGQLVVAKFAQLGPAVLDGFLGNVWVPQLNKVIDGPDRRVCALGMTRMLCETDLASRNAPLWGQALSQTMEVLASEEGDSDAADDGLEDELLSMEERGYENSFARLHFASFTMPEACRDKGDARAFLATSLATASQAAPGTIGGLVAANASATAQHQLQQLLTTAGVSLS